MYMYIYADRPDQYIINCSSTTTGPRERRNLGNYLETTPHMIVCLRWSWGGEVQKNKIAREWSVVFPLKCATRVTLDTIVGNNTKSISWTLIADYIFFANLS